MNIDSSQIVDMLRARGEDDKAAEAEPDLPVTVDTDDHKDMLTRLGIDEPAIRGALADRLGRPGDTTLGGLGGLGKPLGVDEPTDP